jgi:hypothetical protein
MGTMKNVFPIQFKGWPQMHQINLKIKGWGRPNLMHNVEDKTFETKQNDEMTR